MAIPKRRLLLIVILIFPIWFLIDVCIALYADYYCDAQVKSIVGDQGNKKLEPNEEEKARYTWVTWDYRERAKCHKTMPPRPVLNIVNRLFP